MSVELELPLLSVDANRDSRPTVAAVTSRRSFTSLLLITAATVTCTGLICWLLSRYMVPSPVPTLSPHVLKVLEPGVHFDGNKYVRNAVAGALERATACDGGLDGDGNRMTLCPRKSSKPSLKFVFRDETVNRPQEDGADSGQHHLNGIESSSIEYVHSEYESHEHQSPVFVENNLNTQSVEVSESMSDWDEVSTSTDNWENNEDWQSLDEAEGHADSSSLVNKLMESNGFSESPIPSTPTYSVEPLSVFDQISNPASLTSA